MNHWDYFNYPEILREAKVRLSEAQSHPTKWSSENKENLLEYWCAWSAHANAASVFCSPDTISVPKELLIRIKNHFQEGDPKDARYSHLKTVDDLADAFVAKCKEAEEQGAQIYKDICEVLK